MGKNKVIQFTAQELRELASWLDETGLGEVRINPNNMYVRGVERTTSVEGYGYGQLASNYSNDAVEVCTFYRKK